MSEQAIKVGDRVRSYDFPGNADCYVEGVVVEITDYLTHNTFRDCNRYAIRVESQMAGGKPLAAEHRAPMVYPPVNGTQSWMGRTMNGVKLVTENTTEGAK